MAAARWIRGAPDGSTFLMGQGQPIPVAAPFLYLLLGSEAALLHDTGATPAERSPIRRTVAEVLEGCQRRILVTHAHGHGDHWASVVPFVDDLAHLGEQVLEGERPSQRPFVIGKDARELVFVCELSKAQAFSCFQWCAEGERC